MYFLTQLMAINEMWTGSDQLNIADNSTSDQLNIADNSTNNQLNIAKNISD